MSATTFFESIAIPLAKGNGWKIAPCFPHDATGEYNGQKIDGKTVHMKMCPRLLEMASSSLDQIRQWANREPNANVCVYARQEKGGLCFLDKDGAQDIRAAYEKETGEKFPKTLLVRSSRRNGTERGHFYFLQTPRTMSFESNIPESKTDGWFSFRVKNEYVCTIGSIHPETKEPYAVIEDNPILPMPDDLLDWLQAQTRRKPMMRKEAKPNGAAREKIPEGMRYNALISEVGRLWQRGWGRDLTIQAGIKWAQENFELPEGSFDIKMVRGEIEHLIDSYAPGELKITGTLPEILVRAGEAPQAADQAEEVLLGHARRSGIFQRGGELVKVIRHEEDRAPRKASKLRIPEGTIRLKPFSAPMLMETLDRTVRFMQWNGRKKDNVRIDCPGKIAINYLSRGIWRLPHLAGIITAPLLRHDGTLLSAQGYDEESRLYLQSDCEWLPLADEPTREDARAALEFLRAPFAEFPFVSDEDRAVEMAVILTALQRRLLMATPLFAFSAPQPRTGKSHLAEAPALLVLGDVPPAFAVSTEDEELRKVLTSILREGYPIINLDNIERPLRSPELCKIITQEKYGDRLLGENSTLSLPTNCLWTATGNNLAFRGDLAQRVLLCRIDAKVQDPEQRSFAIPDIKAHLLDHRTELVHAALTILRAYHVAGRPKRDCPIWGGFEDWSAQIREPMIWAGEADPFLTRKAAITEDPEMENATATMRELSRVFKDRSFTAREAASAANDEVIEAHHKAQYVYPELHAALAAAAGEKGKNVDEKGLGYWLRKWKDRYAGGFQLLRFGPKESRTAQWEIRGEIRGEGNG
jgi:hypothetical protein